MLLRSSSPGCRIENAADLLASDRILTDSLWILGKLSTVKNGKKFLCTLSSVFYFNLFLVSNEHICHCVKIAFVCCVQ